MTHQHILVSIIIPTLNESIIIQSTLNSLQPLREHIEIIVVDGGSIDNTADCAKPLCDRVLHTQAGRSLQMNSGAKHAHGTYLCFLHADTQIPETSLLALLQNLQLAPEWGRFNIRLSGSRPALRLVETFMNWRSRLTGIATGDQGIFVKAATFKQVGMFAPIPLMEDIVLSSKLKRIAKPLCLRQTITTSSRRWETDGIATTILLMWSLRLFFFLGVSPEILAKFYRRQA